MGTITKAHFVILTLIYYIHNHSIWPPLIFSGLLSYCTNSNLYISSLHSSGHDIHIHIVHTVVQIVFKNKRGNAIQGECPLNDCMTTMYELYDHYVRTIWPLCTNNMYKCSDIRSYVLHGRYLVVRFSGQSE